MTSSPAKVFLHVGTRKSGTTSLQKSLLSSAGVLADHGVHVLFPDRAVARVQLMAGLRRLRDHGEEAPAAEAVRGLVDEVRGHDAPAHVLSLETLAEMPRPVTDLVVGALADYEVHVIVTARHWGLTIPSEWQQGIKSRWKVSYADFIEAIRVRDEQAAGFLARQDLGDIIDRWGALLPREQVHVVACPPRSRTEGTLFELFAAVVGFDPALLGSGDVSHNTSLSLAQAEMLRRVNSVLGERLQLSTGEYQQAIRRWLVRRSGIRHEGTSIAVPDGFAGWVADEARSQLDAVRTRGVDIVGQAEDLLPPDEMRTGPISVADDEVAVTAIETIADLADRYVADVTDLEGKVARLKAERKRLRAELRQLGK